MTQEVMAIDCGNAMDITRVEELYGSLESALDSHCDITLNAADVEHIDTAALQLILTLVRTAKKLKIQVQWSQPSTAIQQAADVLGLQQELGLPAS